MKIANIGNGYVSNETIGRLSRTRVAGLDEQAGADDYQHSGSFRQAAAESALFDEMKKRDDELQGRFDGAPTWDARDIRDYARLESTARMMLQHREDHTDMEFAGVFRELHKRRFLDTPELETAFDRPGDEHANEGRLEDFLEFTDRLNTAKTAEEQQAIIAEQYGKTMPDAMLWEDVKKKSNDGGASYARAYLEKNGRDWGDKAKTAFLWFNNLVRVETEANPDYVPEDEMSPEQRGREMALNVFGLGQTPTRVKKWSSGISEPVFTDADAINEMNARFAMDKARLHAAQTLPFLNQTQRDIVNLAAAGADMSRFRGMLKLMKPQDREMMRNLINAAIPTYDDIDWIPDEGVLRLGSSVSDMGRKSWAVLKGVGNLSVEALKGEVLYVKGDWYNPFSWRMHLISDGAKKRFDDIAQAGLQDAKDYDALVRRKYKTDSGFFGKAWSGLCESMPLQASALGGELLKREGQDMIRRGNAKFGVPIAATGYGLQAFMTLSFWGEHYENMLTHGVPAEQALRISFGAACVDTVIETANLDTWFGKGLTADELRLIGFRGILRSAASRDAGVFWRSLKVNAKHAVKVGSFEDIEEIGQAWNKAGALNYAEGKSLADAYLNNAAFNEGLEAFVDALPTCTAFGITGMADVTGSLRNSALPTYRDNLENVAREMAKREKAQVLGDDVLDKYMAKVNNIAQKISVAMAGKSAKQVGEYLNAQTDMSPAECAFYAEYCALNSAMTATDGANYAAAVLSGSFNEALFAKEGWRFEHDADGNITRIVSPDGKIDEQMRVLNREATLEDFDNERLYDFVTEYNQLVATHPDYKDDAPFSQVGQDTAKADVEAWSEDERARLSEAVKSTPGFTNKDGISIFMLAKAKKAKNETYRHEGTVTHEVLHNLLTKLQETSSKSSEKAISALLATLGMNLDDKKLSMQIADEAQAILGEKAAMLDTTAAIANVLPDKIDGKALAHNIVEAIRRVSSLGLSRGDFVDAFVENRRAETFKDGTPIASGVDPAYYFRNILKNAISDYRKLNAMQREEKAEHKKLVEKILAERKAKRQRKIGLRASERAAHERAERAAAEAEARRIEGERRAAEARATAERREMERRELQYFLSRQTNTMPNLVANDNAVAEGRGAQAVAAYRILWKLAKGQNLTDDEKNTLGEEYGLPIEALTHPESFSDADMARLQDGITRLWTDAANANIVVPPVYVATEADQHRVLPNEVYDPVFQLFRNGEVVVDASRAVPFTPQFAPGAAPDASEETDEETPAPTATSVPTGSQAAPTAATAAQRAPVGGHDVVPAPRSETFTWKTTRQVRVLDEHGNPVRDELERVQMRDEVTEHSLPGGLWNWMHRPFGENESPTASRQDADGHGIVTGRALPADVAQALSIWKEHCPKYMGNKNAMLGRVVKALCGSFTRREREGYTHLNDCFGGGGCWGLSIAMTALPNVKHIIVNEFDEGRIEKIRVLHTLDGQMEAKLRAFLGTRNVVPRIEARMRAQVSERTGNTLSPNGFNTRRWCYEVLEAEIAHLSSEDKGILWAFLDNLQSQMQWAKRDASGANSLAAIIEFTIKSVSKDAVKATELAEAFKARGGEITYSAGDAKQQADFGTKKDTDGVYRRGASGEPLAVPHGGNVMSVTDPPYYLTEGYGESGTRSRVGLEADPMGWGYGDTQQMLGTLVDLRDGIVYTDEAWWFKPEYRFDETRTPREEQILGSIISDFDHFDVAGGVAGRQETLGVQHGRTQQTLADGENAGNDDNGRGLPDGSGVRDVLQPAVPAVAAAAEGQDASTPRADDRSGGQRFWDGNPDTLVDAVTSGATIPRRLRGYANRLLGEAAGAQLRAAGITRFSILPKSGFGIIHTDEGKSYTFDARVHADSPLDLPSDGDRVQGARSAVDSELAATVDRVLSAEGVPGEKPSSSPVASFSRRALLNLFNALNTDAESAELFNRVFPVIDRLGINYSLGQFTGADNTASERGYVLGYYDEHGNVVFNSNVLLRLPPSKFAETILHESIHAVSAYAIARVRNELRMPKAMLNETQRKAAEDLVSLFNDIRGFASSHYGWTDEHEMLAELANPEFRAVLRERGVLERIIDAVKRLFGIEPQTDLDKAVDILDRFLAGADAEAVEAQYRDHYRNNLDLSLFVSNYKYKVERAQRQESMRRSAAESVFGADLVVHTRFAINTRYSYRKAYTDAEVNRLAAQGDHDAIGEYYMRHRADFIALASGRGRLDETTAEDIVHKALFKTIMRISEEGLPEGVLFGSFLGTEIKRMFLNEVSTSERRHDRVRSLETLSLDDTLKDDGETRRVEMVKDTRIAPPGGNGPSSGQLIMAKYERFLAHYSEERAGIFRDRIGGKSVNQIAEERHLAPEDVQRSFDMMIADAPHPERWTNRDPRVDEPVTTAEAHDASREQRLIEETQAAPAVRDWHLSAKAHDALFGCSDLQVRCALLRQRGMDNLAIANRLGITLNSAAHALSEVRRRTGLVLGSRRGRPRRADMPPRVKQVFDYLADHTDATNMEIAHALGMRPEKVSVAITQGIKQYGQKDPRLTDSGKRKMPEEMSACVTLAEQGLAEYQIAERMGCTAAHVKGLLFAARRSVYDRKVNIPKRRTPKAADILGSAAQTDEVRVHTRFSIMGNRAREEAYEAIAKFRPGLHGFVKMVDGVLTPQDDAAVNAIAAFDTPKERKVALFWFCRRAIELPEDRSLVTEAVKTAEKAHVDPFVFDHPGDILEKFAQYRPVEKPIDPATVPELTDRKEHGHGIVSFLVEDTKAGQAAMRRIVNTHLGKDKSPWCLLRADKNGELESDAWHYWMTYSALPKRAAFKDGRLCAFMATDGDSYMSVDSDVIRETYPEVAKDYDENADDKYAEYLDLSTWFATVHKDLYDKLRTFPSEWWDRFDKSHDNIPFSVKDAEGRTLSQELLPDGSVRTYSVTRGDANAKDGVYEEWLDDGAYLKQTRENGFTVSREQFNRNGQMWDWYRSAHNGHCEVEIDRDVENQVSTAYANDTRADTEFWIRRAGKDRWHAYMLQRGANNLMFWTSDADRVVEAFKDIYAAMDSGDYTRAEALFAVEKAAAEAAEAQKNAVTRFSITPRNPQTAAKYYLARDIIENGGRLPDSRYVAHVARSFGLAGNPSELINAAMAEAATQTRVLRYIASDPEIERLVANAGKSVRYENMLKRGREVLLKYSKDADEAKEHQQRALENTVKSVRGEDYERMVTREGIDLDAILRAIRPAEKAPVAHDGSTPDASPDGSATPTPATEAQGKALAERVIERAKELVEAAKEAVRTRSETARTAPTAENATEAGEEPAGRAGADETADDADAEASAVAAAYRRAIAESGITLDNPAEVVQLVKAVTEKYIRDNPGEVSDLDPADVWASPIARAKFAGNLARWAQDVAAAYSPSHARIRVAKKCQMLNDRGVNTVAALERIGEEIFRDLNKDIIRQSRASLIGDIRKIAKGAGAHFTERVEAKDRKVSADTARYCSFVTWALNVPAAKVEETMLELEAFLNGYGGDLSEADKNRYKDYAEAQLKRQLLDLYGNLRARMPAELTEIRDRLAQMVDEGLFDSMCFSEQWEDARNAGVEAIVPGIVANPADKGVQPEPSWWRDRLYSLVGMWETKWRQLTRFCKDDAARTRALEMTGRVEELIQSAEDVQFNYMQEQKRKLRDLLGSVYGGEAEAREAISAEIDPALWHTLDRGDQHTQWTVGRLLQMYVSCVQPDYADNCEKYGRDAAYVAHLEGVIRALDPRHFALITGLRSLYLEQGDALSAVMERTSGTRLYTPNRVYMPVDPLRTHDIGKKGEGRGYSPFAASLTPRVKHGLDFDQRTDILELFVDRAEDAAHTIGWAENGSMVLGICQSDRVLNAIRTAFGSKAMGQWNNYVLDILAGKNETSSGDEAKFVGVLARYASRLWIGLNPVSWAKQIMSFPCFALSLDGTLKDVVCSGAFWLLHPIQMFRCAKDLADTRAFQARYGIAISQELKYATSTEGAFKTWWAKYIDAIMKGVYSFDKLTVMMQAGIYRRRRAQLEKNGMPAHEASETAASWMMHIVDKTAQTARTLNTTQLQRAGGAWAFFLQFKSAPAQQTQFEVVAAQEAMANPRDAKRWKKLAEVIAINHIIVPAMNTAIESLFAAAVQGGMPDEEKRKRQLATLLANMLSGSLGSIVFIGLVVEGLASALMDLCVLDRKPSAYNFGRSQIPAFSVIGNAFNSYNQFAKALEEMDYNGVTHTAIEMATAIGGVIPGLSWPSRTAEKAHKAMDE